MQNENINDSIAYHKQRIASHQKYLESSYPACDEARDKNDYRKIDELNAIAEITRQRIKENEEIIRELTKELKAELLSKCCNAPMAGGVQCEACGSNGK